MTGFYPDALGPRMAFDRDGTLGFNITSTGSTTALTTTQLQQLNDEADGSTISISQNGFLVLIFPENRDVSAMFRRATAGNTVTVQSSTDTTNGFDGTWSTMIASGAIPTANTQPNYRTQSAISTNNTAVKAVRIANAGTTTVMDSWHVCGKASAASPNKLELWHPTLDQPLYTTPAFLDFGDLPRNSVVTKQFRLKNRSASMTATTITVSVEALTDSAGTTKVSEMTLSYNGGSYASTASLASLGPGGLSQVFTLKNSPGAASVLGLWSQRIIASATTFA